MTHAEYLKSPHIDISDAMKVDILFCNIMLHLCCLAGVGV